MEVRPFILGTGNAGRAVAKALALLREIHPEWELEPVTWLSRSTDWSALGVRPTDLLVVANPHGLHASTVLKARETGFCWMAVEKPVAVRLEDLGKLREIPGGVAVFHGYRCLWGPRRLKNLVDNGELGSLISIEGRYWQSSAAQRALDARKHSPGWKDEPALSGVHDVLLDLGTHFVDLAFHLAGDPALKTRTWLSYANAESSHRDTHVHLTMEFPHGVRALGSISKTVHGAGNQLEITVVGTKGSAQWKFDDPDTIRLGRGSVQSTLVRSPADPGEARLAPFHGMGWLEGYVTVLAYLIRELRGEGRDGYPTLAESLAVTERLLSAEPL